MSGPNLTDRGKVGIKRITLVDAGGPPLGVVSAPANRHDSPLLAPTLDLLKGLGPLQETTFVHPDAGYDSGVTRILLAERGLQGAIAHKGLPAPVQATKRWPVDAPTPGTATSTSWTDAPNEDRSSDFTSPWPTPSFWSADSYAEALSLYRWDTRPRRRP